MLLATQQTPHVKPKDLKANWWIIDLENQTLGRIATRLADVLRGKHKALYSRHLDNGDFIVAINAKKIRLTGKKWSDKTYYKHSGFPGGIKAVSAEKLLEKHPDALIKKAVKGMLPKNDLSRKILSKLKVYEGAEHPHEAQNPKPLSIKEKKQPYGNQS